MLDLFVRVLINPRSWLLAQGFTVLYLSLVLDRFALLPIDMDGYWNTMREVENNPNAREMLANVRTLGYPLFLRLVTLVSPTLWLLPFCQLAVRVLAVSVFYGGLVRVGFRPWLAFAVSTPLLYANIILSLDDWIRCTLVMTDAVGESLLILCAGLLFGVLARPARLLGWVGFALGVFVLYQVRPVYQFMVLLFPLLGVGLFGLVQPDRDTLRLRWRVAGGLLVATFVPFLGWCAFRLAVVGHFGLVSFTGNTLGGIAGQILYKDVLEDIPEEHREFAEAVVERREAILRGKIPRLFGPWKPAYDKEGHLIPNIVDNDDTYLFAQIDLFQEVAEAMYGHDFVQRDRKSMQVALAVFRARPEQYLQWCLESWRRAPDKVLRYNYLLIALLVVLAGLLMVWNLLTLLACFLKGWKGATQHAQPAVSYQREFQLMLALAFSVAIVQCLLTGAMIAFLPRYYDSPGVFLPSVVVLGLAAVWQRVWALLFPSTPPALPFS